MIAIGSTNNFLKVAGYSSALAWTPASVPGVDGWYDATDSDTVTETGSGVSTWADKSSSGNDATQSTDASRPGYVSGQYVDYTAGNQYLDTGFSVNTNAWGVFLVGQVDNLAKALIGQTDLSRFGPSRVDWEIGSVGGSSSNFVLINTDGRQ